MEQNSTRKANVRSRSQEILDLFVCICVCMYVGVCMYVCM